APGRETLRGAIIHPLDRPADDAAAQSLARSGALSVRDRWRSDLALGVQPATAPGTDGFTAVFVALAHRDGMSEASRRYDLRLDEGWEFAGTLALDLVRRYLSGED
ncbi:MAG TPA: competence/damage-inducible protein A, partial [Roseiflexaceae bacterium]|nr:competence/damage-inducible protein A [Roseiflexaceae bacterium]